MGVFDFGSDDHQRNRDAYNQIYQDDVSDEHKAKWSHELVAGGAAFYAMHEYEKKQREEGNTVNHGFAKELLAGFAAGEVDRLAETKGLDFIDREKAKYHARHLTEQDIGCRLEAEQLYNQQYGGLQEGGNYNL